MAAIIIDWEWRGKPDRQAEHDTEINRGGVDDLIAIREAVDCDVICRVNNHPAFLHEEASLAVQHGADEILLPMFRRIEEVERLLDVLDGRARLGVLVETVDAMQLGRDLEHLPLSRVYVGLHDYRIDTGNHDLFQPLVDGTLDRFRDAYQGRLRLRWHHAPGWRPTDPQTHLLAAMLRLDCSFGVALAGVFAPRYQHKSCGKPCQSWMQPSNRWVLARPKLPSTTRRFAVWWNPVLVPIRYPVVFRQHAHPDPWRERSNRLGDRPVCLQHWG
ncbi:MAG: hypothetical protein H7A20_04005 [Rhodanobacteraceae bacterium]|nr:hypothetical protein [Rhodanobacteraceae bacterium]